MFSSRILLAFLLAIVPFSYATAPDSQGVSEEEINLAIQQIDQFFQMVEEIGGLYVVTIVEPSSHAQKKAVEILYNASCHELCIDFMGMPEPHTIVFGSPLGKIEAEKVKAALEVLGCVVELNEIVM